MKGEGDDLRPMTLAEKITTFVVLVPFFGLLGLAWYALMYPVLF